MKQGKTLAGLGKELERQRKARKDFVADTRSLELASSGGRSELAVIGLGHEGGLLLRDEEGAAIDIVADARAVVGLDFSCHIDGHPLLDGFHHLLDIAADGVDNLDFPSLGDDGGEQL